MQKHFFYKGADQLHGSRAADQNLCFRYIDSTITLLLKSEISSLYSLVCVEPGRKPHSPAEVSVDLDLECIQNVLTYLDS